MALILPYARFLRGSFEHRGAFGRTLTVGRLSSYVTLDHARRIKGLSADVAAAVAADSFCTTFLLKACGASNVEAIDYSAYEGAERVWDLNVPVPAEWHEQYDTIVDGGTLEHVFHAPVALASLMQMLKPGGRLFVSSPANNHCGHGFYQFSPEFFYRALSAPQGFRVRKMMLFVHAFPGVELSPEGRCYRVADPAMTGGRVRLQSPRASMLFVEAKREQVVRPFGETPQQSDYTALWQAAPAAVGGAGASGRTGGGVSGVVRAIGRPVARWLSRSALVRGGLQRWRDASLRNRRSFTPADCQDES
jgi:SAM-dependent methyltransferase